MLSNEWDQYADSWDSDPSVKEYAKNAFSALVATINIDGLRVLDFGCGTGALTELISPSVRKIVAIDPSSDMIKHLNNKALNNVVSVADYLSEDLISHQPELIEQFDLIVASSVCSFLPDYETTLSLLASLLKEQGSFVQWDWLSDNDSDEMGLSVERVKQAFATNNLVNTTITTPFSMNSSKGQMPVLMAIGKNSANISQANR